MDVQLVSVLSIFNDKYVEIEVHDTLRELKVKIIDLCDVDDINYYDFIIINGNYDGDHIMTMDTKLCDHINNNSTIKVDINVEQSAIIKLKSYNIKIHASTIFEYMNMYADTTVRCEIVMLTDLLLNVTSVVNDGLMVNAIQRAVYKGCVKILQLLCDNTHVCKSINFLDNEVMDNEYTCHVLVNSLLNNNDECTNIICNMDDVEVRIHCDGSLIVKASCNAINMNNITALKLICKNNMKHADGQRDDGINMLIMACVCGNVEIVKWLLDLNVYNVHTEDNKGCSAAMYASAMGHQTILDALNIHNVTGVELRLLSSSYGMNEIMDLIANIRMLKI